MLSNKELKISLHCGSKLFHILFKWLKIFIIDFQVNKLMFLIKVVWQIFAFAVDLNFTV